MIKFLSVVVGFLFAYFQNVETKEGGEKFLIFDYYHTDQDALLEILSKYPRMRDIYGPNAPFFIPNIIMANAIAIAANATVLAKLDAPSSIIAKHPSILPAVKVFDTYRRTAQHIWRTHRRNPANNGTFPMFVQIRQTDIQFGYCDTIRRKQENIWEFTIFTNCFDLWIWLCIIVSFVLISMLVSRKSILVPNVLFTLSPLITPGLSGGNSSSSPGIFTLWLYACIILTNFYTGLITSLLIMPSPPDVMSTISDLHARNYSLIYGHPQLLDAINATVLSHFSRLRSNNNAADLMLHRDMTIIRDLLSTVKIIADGEEFAKVLAYGVNSSTKYATVTDWPIAMLGVGNATLQIRDKTKRGCFVGKKLLPSGPAYFVFLPPGNYLRFRDLFQRFVEAGIEQLWGNEVYGLAHSLRVQDRTRVVSPTHILSDWEGSQVAVLALKGKVATIFLLWSLCLAVSITGLIIEIEFMKLKRWYKILLFKFI